MRPATLLFFLSVGEEGPQLGAGNGQRQLETKFQNVQAVLLQGLGLGRYYCDITSDFVYLFLGENKYFDFTHVVTSDIHCIVGCFTHSQSVSLNMCQNIMYVM